MWRRAGLVSCCGLLAAGWLTLKDSRPSDDGLYKFIAQIAIGGEGGWDYASVDAASRRLYVTHATRVIVIDLVTNAVVGEIVDTPGVHGFAIAPELGLGYSSYGQENRASIVDLKTLRTTSKVPTWNSRSKTGML